MCALVTGVQTCALPISWADLSRTIAPLYATAGTIRDSGALAAEVDRIAAATSDPKARADAALRLVQNEIRYLYRGMENRSEEHTSELQSLMRISYAVFCLKKKKINIKN